MAGIGTNIRRQTVQDMVPAVYIPEHSGKPERDRHEKIRCQPDDFRFQLRARRPRGRVRFAVPYGPKTGFVSIMNFLTGST